MTSFVKRKSDDANFTLSASVPFWASAGALFSILVFIQQLISLSLSFHIKTASSSFFKSCYQSNNNNNNKIIKNRQKT